jgi:hypothetical protein
MKRRSSGQVLIGAATLMLVILLTMAASLPVIDTSIDPSSEAMNVMAAISETLAKRVFLEIGAAQCANEMIGRPTFVISGVAAVAAYEARNAFVERLKNLYRGAGEIKDLKVEVLVSSFGSDIAGFGGPNAISSSEQAISRLVGDITVDIKIEFRVTFYIDKGKDNRVFKKFIYKEQFIASTELIYGGLPVYIDTNPVANFSNAMPVWLDKAIGLIPVIGDVYDLAGAREYFKYKMHFNVGRAIEIKQYDARGALVGSRSIGEGGIRSYSAPSGNADPKVNSKLLITFFNRPDKSYKVFLDTGSLYGVIPVATATKDRKIVELTEYYNIDWVTATLALIGILPLGDLAKILKAKPKVKQDFSSEDGLDGENILLFNNKNIVNNMVVRKESSYKVREIKATVGSNMNNQGRLFANIKKELTGDVIKEAVEETTSIAAQVAAAQALKNKQGDFVRDAISLSNKIIKNFMSAVGGIDSDFGKHADGGRILNSMVQQELLQNLGSRSNIKLFSDQDPFMWVLYPRPGGGAYSACVWLKNYYPILGTK